MWSNGNNTSLSVESVISQAGVCDMHLTSLDTKILVGNAGRIVVLGPVSACLAPSLFGHSFQSLLGTADIARVWL